MVGGSIDRRLDNGVRGRCMAVPSKSLAMRWKPGALEVLTTRFDQMHLARRRSILSAGWQSLLPLAACVRVRWSLVRGVWNVLNWLGSACGVACPFGNNASSSTLNSTADRSLENA